MPASEMQSFGVSAHHVTYLNERGTAAYSHRIVASRDLWEDTINFKRAHRDPGEARQWLAFLVGSGQSPQPQTYDKQSVVKTIGVSSAS
jgi:hypothetical protein